MAKHLAGDIEDHRGVIEMYPAMKELITRAAMEDDNGDGGRIYLVEGDTLHRPRYTATLRSIMTHGPDHIYTPRTATVLSSEITALGGILTLSVGVGFGCGTLEVVQSVGHYREEGDGVPGSMEFDGVRWSVSHSTRYNLPPTPTSSSVAALIMSSFIAGYILITPLWSSISPARCFATAIPPLLSANSTTGPRTVDHGIDPGR